MAMATATIAPMLSFNRLPFSPIRKTATCGISLTHFNKHVACILKLSSSHSIYASGLQTFVIQKRIPSFNSPPDQSPPSSLSVFAAKGYKVKTHKGDWKRKNYGKESGKQHLLAKKNTKRNLRLSKMVQVNRSDYDNVIGASNQLDLKVNRKV